MLWIICSRLFCFCAAATNVWRTHKLWFQPSERWISKRVLNEIDRKMRKLMVNSIPVPVHPLPSTERSSQIAVQLWICAGIVQCGGHTEHSSKFPIVVLRPILPVAKKTSPAPIYIMWPPPHWSIVSQWTKHTANLNGKRQFLIPTTSYIPVLLTSLYMQNH